MWLRLSAILLCVVFFITGCNSLVSQLFGTHKLRTMEMEDFMQNGLGDSDYIGINHAWQSGDYLIVPPKNQGDKAILIYPILSEGQKMQLERGEKVQPRIIGWTKRFDPTCDEVMGCAPVAEVDIQGVVRRMNNNKNKAHLLPENRYIITEDVEYIEVGRAPIAWYWNLLMIVGGIALAIFIESRAYRQRRSGKAA